MAFKPPRVYAVQLNTKNDDIDDDDDDVVQRFNVHLKLTSQPSLAHLAKVKTDMHAREKTKIHLSRNSTSAPVIHACRPPF